MYSIAVFTRGFGGLVSCGVTAPFAEAFVEI